MRPVIYAVISALLLLTVPACSGAGWNYYPTYPDDGYYDGSYGGNHKPPKDAEKLYTAVEGEWEGYLYENYRSDHMALRKRPIALRCTYSDITWSGSTKHEWVNADLVVDGRPAARTRAEVGKGGYLSFSSYKNDIEVEMEGWFSSGHADGWIDLCWQEKVKLPGKNKTEMHDVHLYGDFDLNRDKDSHWADMWQLFDLYGDGVFELGDETWENAYEVGPGTPLFRAE
jgi:hypothetical protein